jgi:gamma-D-glutamyl-L-lysine dipeptidyl-peptidase
MAFKKRIMPLHAICAVPVGALRKDPVFESEMVSQLLFGEGVALLETPNAVWARVRCLYDGYEGWAQQNQLTAIDFEPGPSPLAAGYINQVLYNGSPMQVPLGCPLTGLHQGRAQWGNDTVVYEGPVHDPATGHKDEAAIAALAHRFLNTGYLWGGRSVFGIDCSGFTQAVYRFFGMALPRDAYQQAKLGDTVDFLQAARCGDLAFFDNEEGHIIHVGLVLNTGQIIHAGGKVRVDRLDHAGIVHTQTGQHTHRLRIIKRYW